LFMILQSRNRETWWWLSYIEKVLRFCLTRSILEVPVLAENKTGERSSEKLNLALGVRCYSVNASKRGYVAHDSAEGLAKSD